MDRREKNKRIAETRRATIARHQDMVCRCFEVKIDRSKLSKKRREEVNLLFREAKWFRNAFIADMEGVTYKDTTVKVKVGDEFETRDITLLGSQIRQSIIHGVKESLKSLRALKDNGNKVGRLRFKSVCNCIELKQYHVTYDIDMDRSCIRVQGIKKPFRVRGLEQIPADAEIANCKFIRKASGLYFHITCFLPKQEKILPDRSVGIDFGIKDNLTFSDGSAPVNVCVPESKGIKLASRRMNKALKRSGGKKGSNHHKRRNDLRRAYEKNANRKKDLACKTVHDIVNGYNFVAIQDEMIGNWHKGLFGKEVQHSAMGVIKRRLKNSPNVYVVSRSFPSTQICPVCGKLTRHSLDKRDYDCMWCGYHHNSRDVKAAEVILEEAKKIYSSLSGRESSESCAGQALCSETVDQFQGKAPPMGSYARYAGSL